jgi:hypothetical protein
MKSKERNKHPRSRWLTNVRRRVETVISQLAGLYRTRRLRARDLGQLSSRFVRKLSGPAHQHLPVVVALLVGRIAEHIVYTCPDVGVSGANRYVTAMEGML